MDHDPAGGGSPRGTDRNRSIGVFDSGIGGLSVLKSLIEALPGESFIYLGDTARVPYGNKSRGTVTRYAFESLLFLLRHQVKLVVVACNTVSASCLEMLQQCFRLPLFGVIDPAVEAALAATRSGRIGVIGTQGTIGSGAYQQAIVRRCPGIEVVGQACPLLVPLAEEGWIDHRATRQVLHTYLEPMVQARVDTLILGCTHYPILRPAFESLLGESVTLVESGPATATSVRDHLLARDLGADPAGGDPGAGPEAVPGERPRVRYFVTDLQPQFRKLAESFLGRDLLELEVVAGGLPG